MVEDIFYCGRLLSTSGNFFLHWMPFCLSTELVTASGDVIKASKDDNQELFWGMKGYGSNFG